MSVENVKQAYVMFNGQKVMATYSEELDVWTAEFTAPAESSWNQPNHVYLAEIHAEDLAGNKTTLTSTSAEYGDQLKFRVLEKTKPSVTISSPTQDAVIGVSSIEIRALISDSGRSGLNRDSIVMKLNGVSVTPLITDDQGEDTIFGEEETPGGSFEEVDAGDSFSEDYSGESSDMGDANVSDESVGEITDSVIVTYSAENLSDGINTVEVSAIDNDGNSESATVTFVISTAAPLLEVYTPTEGLITNGAIVNVTGKATSSSEYVDISTVTVNSNTATVLEDGTFAYDLSLTSGPNTVEVIATDTVGKSTKITRNVILDTFAPVITDVYAEATTVDASGTIRITFRVTDA